MKNWNNIDSKKKPNASCDLPRKNASDSDVLDNNIEGPTLPTILPICSSRLSLGPLTSLCTREKFFYLIIPTGILAFILVIIWDDKSIEIMFSSWFHNLLYTTLVMKQYRWQFFKSIMILIINQQFADYWQTGCSAKLSAPVVEETT